MIKTVDVILFMGQSNMAGRGDNLSLVPFVEQTAGYEYRAVSQPDRLVPVTEPFGALENNPDGVYEPGMKSGSMVSSYMNACYENTGVPIVGVSCSKGGSSILEWMPGTAYWRDAVDRYEKAVEWLKNHEYQIRSISIAWCQGCTDGDNGMDSQEYKKNTRTFFEEWFSLGVQQIFLIQTGNHRDEVSLYVPVQEAQEELAAEMDGVIMVSRQLKEFRERGLMRDCYHYKQAGYNIVGTEAGAASGKYLHQKYS